jgi:hypothetical protein
MATCWFIVIESTGRWWVDCEGRAYGPLDSEDEAIRYARKIADIYGDPARQSQVWVPRRGGRPVLVWSGKKPTSSTPKRHDLGEPGHNPAAIPPAGHSGVEASSS